MNIALGQSALFLGVIGALAGLVTLALGLRNHNSSLLRAGNSYIWLVLGGAVVATIAMQRALITHDFTLVYVDNNDSTFTPLIYRITAMWSDLAGSILLWALVLSAYLAAMWLRYRSRANEPIVIWAKLTGYAIALFFFAVMLTASDPFDRVHGAVPTQGPGANPLLQDRVLVAFHPPMLYLGLVGFTVPFCFAIAGLVTGTATQTWLAETRRWAIFAWACLTLGLVLGAWWAFQVLGWGYWSWDPVENSALMPWLTATAFIHSAMVQQHRAILRVWNLSLLLATFSLTILGTYFTRSGVLASVHSFTEDGAVGPAFLGFFSLVVAVGLGLLIWRGDRLRTSGTIELLSREGTFLLNNFLFAAFTFVVLLGTVFPLLVEALNGSTVTVGLPFFDPSTMPVVLGLLFLMAISPLLPWRHTTKAFVARRLLWPAAAAVVVLWSCLVFGARGFWPLVVFALAGAAGATALARTGQLVRASGPAGLFSRAGGGMIAHLGIVIVAVAFAASQGYKHEALVTLQAGKPVHFQGHTLVLEGTRQVNTPGKTSLVVTVLVDGHAYYPAVDQYALSDQPVISPAEHSGLTQDIQLTLNSVPGAGRSPVSVNVYVEPLITWLWTGGAIAAAGGLISIAAGWGRRRPSSAQTSVDVRLPDLAPEAVPV